MMGYIELNIGMGNVTTDHYGVDIKDASSEHEIMVHLIVENHISHIDRGRIETNSEALNDKL